MRLLSMPLPVALALALAATGAARATPAFVGAPATPRPYPFTPLPEHPFTAPTGSGGLHQDAYQSDTAPFGGPLGDGTEVLQASPRPGGSCGTLTFDSRGRVVAICIDGTGPRLLMMDPRTLAVLASYDLPTRRLSLGSPSPLNDTAGGAYFYLDNRDRAVLTTTDRHILVVAETGGAADPRFKLDRDYDLTPHLAEGDRLPSVLADFAGRLWFTTTDGVVGTIDPASGAVREHPTGEPIENSFAVDETGGVFVVTDTAMYRFDAGADGGPAVTWREAYPNIGSRKSGQLSAGSGTTPTVFGHRWVAITDNADPMNIVVYDRRRRAPHGRVVCSAPVFDKGASSSDNSIVAVGRAMMIENNYGYSNPASTAGPQQTAGGVQRVDIDRDGRGCHDVWRNPIDSPSTVPKLSLANGLLYLYTKTADASEEWYFTALDFRTGKLRFSLRTGNGIAYNNAYIPISLGPDGTAYVGILGGMLVLRDPAADGARRYRLALEAVRLRGGRTRVRLVGTGLRRVVRALRATGTRGRGVAVRRGRLSAVVRGRARRADIQLVDGQRIRMRPGQSAVAELRR